MTEKEALKLALEALKYPLNQSHENFNVDMAELLAHRAITAIKEALAEQPAQQDSTCSNALRIQHKAYPRTCKKCGLGPCVELAQQALDKMAENARELGLDYEPAQRKPLTDEQTKLLWHKARLCIGPRWMVFKRLVEAAHGIKENT